MKISMEGLTETTDNQNCRFVGHVEYEVLPAGSGEWKGGKSRDGRKEGGRD
jgi:hypothetical protein